MGSEGGVKPHMSSFSLLYVEEEEKKQLEKNNNKEPKEICKKKCWEWKEENDQQGKRSVLD